MLANNLIDVWRIRNPQTKLFTWRQKNPFIQRRIDYWLISDDYKMALNEQTLLHQSNHSAITLSFNSLKDQPFGPSYWKFNASLLQDENYIQLINTEYPKWLTEFSEVLVKRVLWDLVKYRIRQTTIKYSKQIAKNRKSQLHTCEQNLKQWEENCSLDPSEENIAKMDTAKNEY